MLTAHKIKILQSLDKKKYRQKYNLFLVEGNKIITELQYSPYKVREIYSIDSNLENKFDADFFEISSSELKKISFLQNPKDSVAVCELITENLITETPINLILDGIQDPGNLGTIIRLADWFGIDQIICSEDTVDLYNPKVLQATKGSFARVKIIYTDILGFLKENNHENIGTDMEGKNMYTCLFPEKFNLILGNEGNGMRAETENLLHQKITIPRFGVSKNTESLNVAIAASLILGQIFSKK